MLLNILITIFSEISFFEKAMHFMDFFKKSLFWEVIHKIHLPVEGVQATEKKKKKSSVLWFKGWRINKGSGEEPGSQADSTNVVPLPGPSTLPPWWPCPICLALCSVQLGFGNERARASSPSDPVFQKGHKYPNRHYTRQTFLQPTKDTQLLCVSSQDYTI